MAELTGLPAIIDAEAREAPSPVVPSARQPSLFAEPELSPPGDGAGEDAAHGRRGRPPGARNRRTADLAAYIAGHVGHPVVRLARIAAMDPAQLAQALGCKQVEALDRIIVAAKAAAPYVASAMPQEVQVSGKGGLAVGIVPLGLDLEPGDRIVGMDAMAALDQLAEGIVPAEIMENQSLSADDRGDGNAHHRNAEEENHGPSTG